MGHAMKRTGALGLLALTLVLSACVPGNNGGVWGVGSTQGDASTQGVHARGGIVVAIPPEVAPVMHTLVPVWTGEHPGVPLAFIIAPAVRSVINQNTYIGVDVLITDVRDLQEEALAQGIIRSIGVPFAATTLDFVVPAANPGNITRLQDTSRPGLRLVNVTWSSGVAQATLMALEKMMRYPEFAPGAIPCQDNYASCTYGNMVVTVADGLSAARLLVNASSSGIPLSAQQVPLEGAFVYHTDYLQAQSEVGASALRALPLPASAAPPQRFWCAVASQAQNVANAQAFQSFLLSPAAQTVLRTSSYLAP